MAISLNLLKNKKFQDWYMRKMVNWACTAKGYSKEQATGILLDSFANEMNVLFFVLGNSFPDSRPTGDKDEYVFISSPIEHDLLDSSHNPLKTFYPGRLHLRFTEPDPQMTFPDEPTFIHGHIKKSNNQIRCYGGYNRPNVIASNSGFSGLLMDMLNFASKAYYRSTINGEPSLIAKHYDD